MSSLSVGSVTLLLDAMSLAQLITHKTIELDKAGALYEGHRIFDIGFRAWERYSRRMITARVVGNDQVLSIIPKAQVDAARLYVEADNYVGTLKMRLERLLGSEHWMTAKRVAVTLDRAKARRARRLRSLIEAVREVR